jgi:4-hydroxybenzoate polyprenyltransferase
MADDPGELDAIDREVERALERQRRTVDTSRVVVVFAAGVGASVSAAAWQVLGATPLTLAAAAALGAALLFMIFSFFADEREDVDIDRIVHEATQGGYLVRDALSSWNRTAASYNESVVETVIYISIAQALTSLTAAALAAAAMLLGVSAP